MGRRRSKSSQRGFDLLSSGVGYSERTIGRITSVEGEAMVRGGRAVRILHVDTNVVAGYQLCAVPAPNKSPGFLRDKQRPVVVPAAAGSDASSAAFSRAEVDAIVGLRGESRTAHLSEEQRAQRILRKWRGEDIVESAQQKIRVYRDVH